MGGAALAVLVATPAPAAEVPVGVADNMFVPAQVTVQAGDTVTWEQTGDNPHSVTSDDEGGAGDGAAAFLLVVAGDPAPSDGAQPRLERGVAAIGRGRRHGLGERLLQQVLGRLGVTTDSSEDEPVHDGAGAVDQDADRVGPARRRCHEDGAIAAPLGVLLAEHLLTPGLSFDCQIARLSVSRGGPSGDEPEDGTGEQKERRPADGRRRAAVRQGAAHRWCRR